MTVEDLSVLSAGFLSKMREGKRTEDKEGTREDKFGIRKVQGIREDRKRGEEKGRIRNCKREDIGR